MAQLHLYVSDSVAAELRRRAKARGLTVSKYLSEIVRRELSEEWPRGFFTEVVGGWSGDALERPPQAEPEAREPL